MSEKKPVAKAIVLSDGNVVPRDYLQRYTVKAKGAEAKSKQIPEDAFSSMYEGATGLVAPLYNPEALARLMEVNTYHYRCVKTKAMDVVGLGWALVPADGVENPNEDQKKEVEEFLNNPHPEQTLGEVLKKWWQDYESIGYCALEVIREAKQRSTEKNHRIVGLHHIPAHTIRIHRDGDRFVQIRGTRKVWFKRIGAPFDLHAETGEKYELGQLDADQRANEVMYLVNYTSRSDYYGTPDVLPALGALLGDKQREEYNIDFFENFGVPAYAVTVVGTELTDEVIEKIKKYFQYDLKEARHSTLVLTAQKDPTDPEAQDVKFEFHPLAVDVKEASFRLYRKDNRDEILSAHGVPPYRAGIAEEGSLGGSTAKESTEIYKQSIILPRQEIVESRINKHILEDAFGVTDWRFEFERIDTRDEKMDTYLANQQFDLGILTPNKLREMFGEEPIKDPELQPIMDMPFIKGKPALVWMKEIQSTLNPKPASPPPPVPGEEDLPQPPGRQPKEEDEVGNEDIVEAVKALRSDLARAMGASRK